MKPRRPLSVCLLPAVLLMLMTVVANADDEPLPTKHALTLKGGAFRLDNENQNVGGESWKLDGPYLRFAIEGEVWVDDDKHFSVGGEFMRFSSDYHRSGSSSG